MTKKFPTLYARDSKGKIREWDIVVEDNTYYVISGAQNEKKITSKPTICKGKNIGRSNETTPEGQALFEANAKWEKQLKSGGYWQNVADIDQNKFVAPMLANKVKDRKSKIILSSTKPWIAQRKFNGMRGIATRHGLFSRKGEKYVAVPHIEESLAPLFERDPNMVLDGEFYNFELRQQLNEIAKLIRRTEHITPEHLERTKQIVQYHVYDGYGFGDINGDGGIAKTVVYRQRKQALDAWILNVPYLHTVKDYYVYSWSDVDTLFNQFIEDGDEGLMLRDPESEYEHKRSNNLLKLKPEDDDEFQIIGIEEGEGNWAGFAKVIFLKDPQTGKTFKGTFKGTQKDALECLKNQHEWIGKTVTIEFTGYSGLGTPLGAQFNYRNCLKGDR